MKTLKIFSTILLAFSFSDQVFGQQLPASLLSYEEMNAVYFSKCDTLGFKPLSWDFPMSDFEGRENRFLRHTMQRVVNSNSTVYDMIESQLYINGNVVKRSLLGKKIYYKIPVYGFYNPKYRITHAGIEIIGRKYNQSPSNDVISYDRHIDYFLIGLDGKASLVKTIEVDTKPTFPTGTVVFNKDSLRYIFPESEVSGAPSVQVLPRYKGETDGLEKYMTEQLHYPLIAIEHGIRGNVDISFTIGSDGSVTRLKTISAPDRLLDEAATRPLRGMIWTPGSVDGVPTPVEVVFSVDFKINYAEQQRIVKSTSFIDSHIYWE